MKFLHRRESAALHFAVVYESLRIQKIGID